VNYIACTRSHRDCFWINPRNISGQEFSWNFTTGIGYLHNVFLHIPRFLIVCPKYASFCFFTNSINSIVLPIFSGKKPAFVSFRTPRRKLIFLTARLKPDRQFFDTRNWRPASTAIAVCDTCTLVTRAAASIGDTTSIRWCLSTRNGTLWRAIIGCTLSITSLLFGHPAISLHLGKIRFYSGARGGRWLFCRDFDDDFGRVLTELQNYFTL